MSYLRVTEASASYGSLAGLQYASGRLAALQQQMSTGRQITKPSDDPAGTVRALQLRAQLKRNDQYSANADDGLAWLSTADGAYSQIVKLAQQARTLVVQGLNTGAQSSQGANALADEIDAIRSSIIGQANATYNGRPVFGGTTTGAVAYDSAGNYVGDNGTVSRAIGDTSSVQINQTGPQIFGAAGSDLFTLLSNISATLRTNPAALTPSLSALDSAIGQISTAQGQEGAVYSRIQQTQQAQTAASVDIKTELSNIQDIDLAEMAVQVTTANTTYQAALQTTANVRQLSLLEFLK